MAEIVVAGPSGFAGRVRGLKIKELKVLTDKKALRTGEFVDQFLRSAWLETTAAGPYGFSTGLGAEVDWSRVLQADRSVAILDVRIATYGDTYEFDVDCPRCDAKIAWKLPLSKLPRKALPAESIAAFKASKQFDVTIAGKKATFKLLTGADERETAKAARNSDDPVTESVIARITSIEGVTSAGLRAYIENMDASALVELRTAIDAVDGGVDTTITVRCRECRGEPEVEVPFGRAFWTPSAVRSRESAPTSEPKSDS